LPPEDELPSHLTEFRRRRSLVIVDVGVLIYISEGRS
jgi:hypothetical protein